MRAKLASSADKIGHHLLANIIWYGLAAGIAAVSVRIQVMLKMHYLPHPNLDSVSSIILALPGSILLSIVFIFCVGLIIALQQIFKSAAIWLSLSYDFQPAASAPSAPSVPNVSLPQQPITGQPQEPQGTQEPQEIESAAAARKAYNPINRTPEELFHILVDAPTILEGDRRLQPFKDNWVIVSDEIANILNPYSTIVVLFKPLPVQGFPLGCTVKCWFDSSWLSRLQFMRPPERITVLGKLTDADPTSLTLKDCKLIANEA